MAEPFKYTGPSVHLLREGGLICGLFSSPANVNDKALPYPMDMSDS